MRTNVLLHSFAFLVDAITAANPTIKASIAATPIPTPAGSSILRRPIATDKISIAPDIINNIGPTLFASLPASRDAAIIPANAIIKASIAMIAVLTPSGFNLLMIEIATDNIRIPSHIFFIILPALSACCPENFDTPTNRANTTSIESMAITAILTPPGFSLLISSIAKDSLRIPLHILSTIWPALSACSPESFDIPIIIANTTNIESIATIAINTPSGFSLLISAIAKDNLRIPLHMLSIITPALSACSPENFDTHTKSANTISIESIATIAINTPSGFSVLTRAIANANLRIPLHMLSIIAPALSVFSPASSDTFIIAANTSIIEDIATTAVITPPVSSLLIMAMASERVRILLHIVLIILPILSSFFSSGFSESPAEFPTESIILKKPIKPPPNTPKAITADHIFAGSSAAKSATEPANTSIAFAIL